MVESGQEFIMGAPPGVNKVLGTHRDTMIDKLEPRMNVYAQKLRDIYIREGTIPTVKTYINPLREREVIDTLESCIE